MADYIITFQDSSEAYLAHHGILGQKWGVRRYQNEDGRLTDQGRMRYSDAENAYKDRLKFGKLRPEDREYLAKAWKEQENWDKTLSKYEPKPSIIKKTINYADELVSTSVKSPEVIKSLINLGAEILKQNNKKEKEKKKEDSRNKSNEAKEKARRIAAAEEIVEGLEEDEAKHSFLDDPEGYLAHHGILGQKWGVRRYQNKDGTYTEEGKKRRVESFNDYISEASKASDAERSDLAKEFSKTEAGKKLMTDIKPILYERGLATTKLHDEYEEYGLDFKAFDYYYQTEKGKSERLEMEKARGHEFFVDPVDGYVDWDLVDKFCEIGEGKKIAKEHGIDKAQKLVRDLDDKYAKKITESLKSSGVLDQPLSSESDHEKTRKFIDSVYYHTVFDF